MIVTAMVDARAKQRQQEEETKHKKKGGAFGEVFEDACEDVRRNEEVACHTTGYTKDARQFNYNIKMHNYV